MYVIQCQISNSPHLFAIQFLETGLGEFGVISSEILQVFFVLNILPVCGMDNVLKIEGKPHVTNFL